MGTSIRRWIIPLLATLWAALPARSRPPATAPA